MGSFLAMLELIQQLSTAANKELPPSSLGRVNVWVVPKDGKLDSLPNYTYEPCKPVPLGTMFQNGAECISGCLVFQDVVQLPEKQYLKDYHGLLLSMPKLEDIGMHTSQVLQQVEGANIPLGGWVGGNSWFVSVMIVVEVIKKKGVHSTWIIKQNTAYFPLKALHAVLKAKFGDRPAGHWVVFYSTIGEVRLIAMAYTWSMHDGVTYMLSTCGSTAPSEKIYKSYFEDDFGNVNYKEINCSKLAHFMYDYLPIIKEHNKQWQEILGLE